MCPTHLLSRAPRARSSRIECRRCRTRKFQIVFFVQSMSIRVHRHQLSTCWHQQQTLLLTCSSLFFVFSTLSYRCHRSDGEPRIVAVQVVVVAIMTITPIATTKCHHRVPLFQMHRPLPLLRFKCFKETHQQHRHHHRHQTNQQMFPLL